MPWALAAAAVAAGSNYMQQRNNNSNVQRQYNAKNEALAEGVAEQQPNIAKGQNILNTTTQQFQQPQQASTLSDAITNRTKAIDANTGIPGAINTSATGSSSAPTVVNSNLANMMAKSTAFGNQQGAALGAIGGTQDAQLSNKLALNDSGNELNLLTNFAKGDAAVNTAKANAAYNNARKAADPIWGLLGTAANAASMGLAAGGIGGAAGSATGQAAGQVIGGQTGEALATASLPKGQFGPVDVSQGIWS